MLTTFHGMHSSLPEGQYRASCWKQAPEESQGAMHRTAAVGTHCGSSDAEHELTEVTPRYCMDTTTHKACRRTEEGKEKESLTWFLFFPITLKFKVYFNGG